MTVSYNSNLAAIGLTTGRFVEGYTVANNALQALQGFVGSNPGMTLSEYLQSILTSIRPMPEINLLDAPTYDQLDAEFNLTPPVPPPSETFPALPTVIPQPPATNFNFQEGGYTSDVDISLVEKLVDGITNGGTGLGAAVEEGIWNREQERALLELAEAKNRLAGESSDTSFGLPGGAVAAMLVDQETKFSDARLTSNRDIATKQAELAQDMTKAYLTSGLNYEGTKRSYLSSFWSRSLDAAKAAPAIAVEIYKAQVEYINVFVAQYNAIAAKVNAEAEIFKAQVLSYTSQADVKTKIITASVQKYMADVEAIKAANTSELGKDELLLKEFIEYRTLFAAGITELTKLCTQLVASALSGMSATASVGYDAKDNNEASNSYVDYHYTDETS
jgi:hypothetical protein